MGVPNFLNSKFESRLVFLTKSPLFLFIETFERVSTNVTLEEVDMWFNPQMQYTDWPKVVREVAPFLSYTDRDVLLETSGTYAVSPALLVTIAIHYRKEKKIDFKT